MARSETGAIFLQRRVFSLPFLRHDEAFTETEAFIWLLSFAAFQAVEVDGRRLERGDVLTSYRELAGVFHWTDKRVRCWLKRLARDGAITVRGTQKGTLRGPQITLILFGELASAGHTKGHTEGQRNNNSNNNNTPPHKESAEDWGVD